MSDLQIPDDTQKAHPELLKLIIESESMNNEERQYWINILPIMTPEQLQNLRQILVNEKRQLEAIDKKYAKEMDAISSAESLQKTEEERRKRREERSEKEQTAQQEEDQHEAELLSQIENF